MSTTKQRLRVGWFSTGRGAGSRALLRAAYEEIKSGHLNAEISVAFSNRGPGEDSNTDVFLDQVRAYSLPLVTLSSRDFRRARGEKAVRKGEALPDWRREYDREVMRLLAPYAFDIGVLAGYMLIFCEEAAARWDLLNLHPAEPGGPKGIWQDVIWELIDKHADQAGVMIHLATPELDEGPPVTFCTYSIQGPEFEPLWHDVEGRSIAEIKASEGENNPLFQEIRRHGASREIPLVIATLQALADGRLRIEGKHVVVDSGAPPPPVDLSAAVNHVAALSSTNH
jgi:folate-dependent phosphoribosylglycinamide formyltransferase PurN